MNNVNKTFVIALTMFLIALRVALVQSIIELLMADVDKLVITIIV